MAPWADQLDSDWVLSVISPASGGQASGFLIFFLGGVGWGISVLDVLAHGGGWRCLVC